MTAYVLLRDQGGTLLSEGALVRAEDAALTGSLPDIMAQLAKERAEATEARAAAFEDARRRGEAEGRAVGEAAARDDAAAALASALAGLKAARDQARAEAGEVALQLVRRLVPRLAGDALVPEMIRAALAELEGETVGRVRVAPDDLAQAQVVLEDTGLRIEADEARAPGEVVIETGSGMAEAGLDARLSTLAEALRG